MSGALCITLKNKFTVNEATRLVTILFNIYSGGFPIAETRGQTSHNRTKKGKPDEIVKKPDKTGRQRLIKTYMLLNASDKKIEKKNYVSTFLVK